MSPHKSMYKVLQLPLRTDKNHSDEYFDEHLTSTLRKLADN